MADKPENPSAFAKPIHSHGGMSLRDYFAAAALPKSLERTFSASDKYQFDVEKIPQIAAETAYLFADAMLKARAK